MTDHEIRLLFLPWVQAHHIQRYADKTVVSHSEGVEELLELVKPELDRLRRIEAAARAYVNSDPPRPEWRELTHALNPDRLDELADAAFGPIHPIAGKLEPQAQPCSSFMPDGRSEICARCDWPEDAHGNRSD